MFVSTGMLIDRKRQIDVIMALVELRKQGLEPYYYMIGDGANKDQLENLINVYDLRNDQITGCLPQDEMSKYLKMSDVYILASKDDASPKALNEAMNFKLPIIITTGVVTADLLLKEGVNGYIYEPGDVSDLTIKMKQLIMMNSRDRIQMGIESIKYDNIIHGWDDACRFVIDESV